jgi:3-hydroxy acid dehydrogenase / malonic semialdehyde reductase
MQNTLTEKRILITGASSGFGEACARLFGEHRSHLLLGARRLDKLEAVSAAARKAGASSVSFRALDVTKRASVNEFIAWVKSEAAQVDILVNNAGLALGLEPVEQGDEADWITMMDTNVIGLLRMTKAVIPFMRGRPGAAIINIGSLAGHVAYENGAAYCASKAAVRQISRALRLELSGSGIRVCSIDPGMAETEFSLVRFKGDQGRANRVYEGVEPLTANDVAEAIVWAAQRPPHVCIDEMLIKCTDQAALHKVHRRSLAGNG